jgi:N6-adenosine-specific RNA methylase IME4
MSALALPAGPFGAILADPPWRFATWSPLGRDRSADKHYLKQARACGAAEDAFTTLPLEDICAMPVADCAADDAVLFLWACCPLLREALQVIEAWGFTYKTCGFTWTKLNADGTPYMGLGYWTRANAELCLLATRGKPKRINADVPQAILERRREHSRKPDCVHERIERLVPGPYLELFGRQSRPGWVVWGNEATKFDRSDELPPGHREDQPALFTGGTT